MEWNQRGAHRAPRGLSAPVLGSSGAAMSRGPAESIRGPQNALVIPEPTKPPLRDWHWGLVLWHLHWSGVGAGLQRVCRAMEAPGSWGWGVLRL